MAERDSRNLDLEDLIKQGGPGPKNSAEPTDSSSEAVADLGVKSKYLGDFFDFNPPIDFYALKLVGRPGYFYMKNVGHA